MISIIIPSMGRANQLGEVVESIYANVSDEKNIEVILGIVNQDIETQVVTRKLVEKHPAIRVHEFTNLDTSVVAKYNRLAKMSDGKYVMALADDTWMVTKNFDLIIKDEFAKVPDDILMLVMDDGPGYETLNRHTIVSKKWINALGWHQPDCFRHYYTDNVLSEIVKRIGRVNITSGLKLDHRHPAFGTAKTDLVHMNDYTKYWDEDTKTYSNKVNVERLVSDCVGKLESVMDKSLQVAIPVLKNPLEGISLLVGTPAYGGMVHLDYVKTLLELLANGVSFTMYGIGNESLITRGRNTIFSYFMHNKQFTHLLFLDADVYVQGADIKKMLISKQPVIGAPVRLKCKNKTFNINEVKKQGADGIWKVGKLGTAVYMMDRNVCEKLAQLAEEEKRVYDSRSIIMGGDDSKVHDKQWDIFRVGVVDGIYLSEDYFVADQLTKLGYDVNVDMNIYTRHNGTLAVATNEPDVNDEIQNVIQNINNPQFSQYKEQLLSILGMKTGI